MDAAQIILEGLQALTPHAEEHTALHLRVEKDWISHCQEWSGGDNCMGSSQELGRVLQVEGVSEKVPIYIASGIPMAQLKVRLSYETKRASKK